MTNVTNPAPGRPATLSELRLRAGAKTSIKTRPTTPARPPRRGGAKPGAGAGLSSLVQCRRRQRHAGAAAAGQRALRPGRRRRHERRRQPGQPVLPGLRARHFTGRAELPEPAGPERSRAASNTPKRSGSTRRSRPGSGNRPLAPGRTMPARSAVMPTRWRSTPGRPAPTTTSASASSGAPLSGEYLNSNPYMAQMVQCAMDPVTRNYQTSIAPGLDAAAAAQRAVRLRGAGQPSQHRTAEPDARPQRSLGQSLRPAIRQGKAGAGRRGAELRPALQCRSRPRHAGHAERCRSPEPGRQHVHGRRRPGAAGLQNAANTQSAAGGQFWRGQDAAQTAATNRAPPTSTASPGWAAASTRATRTPWRRCGSTRNWRRRSSSGRTPRSRRVRV